VPRITKGPALQPVKLSPIQLGLILTGVAVTSSGSAVIAQGASLVSVITATLVTGAAITTALLIAEVFVRRSSARARRFHMRLDGIERTVADVRADTHRGLQIHRETLDVLHGLAAGHDDGAPAGPHPIQLHPSR
jgi:hypothetical protein